MILAFSEFWKGYLYGALVPIVIAPLVGPWVRRIPWRVRIERRRDVRL